MSNLNLLKLISGLGGDGGSTSANLAMFSAVLISSFVNSIIKLTKVTIGPIKMLAMLFTALTTAPKAPIGSVTIFCTVLIGPNTLFTREFCS